jgi:hypothetical protein
MIIPHIQYHHGGHSSRPFLTGSIRYPASHRIPRAIHLVKLYLPEGLLLVYFVEFVYSHFILRKLRISVLQKGLDEVL